MSDSTQKLSQLNRCDYSRDKKKKKKLKVNQKKYFNYYEGYDFVVVKYCFYQYSGNAILDEKNCMFTMIHKVQISEVI